MSECSNVYEKGVKKSQIKAPICCQQRRLVQLFLFRLFGKFSCIFRRLAERANYAKSRQLDNLLGSFSLSLSLFLCVSKVSQNSSACSHRRRRGSKI